jgi:hypothetical protein
MGSVFKNLTLILLWTDETQSHYLTTSTKEFKLDDISEVCDGMRKEILKFYLELFNSSDLQLEETKQVK